MAQQAAPQFQVAQQAAPQFQVAQQATPHFQLAKQASPQFQVVQQAAPQFQMTPPTALLFQAAPQATTPSRMTPQAASEFPQFSSANRFHASSQSPVQRLQLSQQSLPAPQSQATVRFRFRQPSPDLLKQVSPRSVLTSPHLNTPSPPDWRLLIRSDQPVSVHHQTIQHRRPIPNIVTPPLSQRVILDSSGSSSSSLVSNGSVLAVPLPPSPHTGQSADQPTSPAAGSSGLCRRADRDVNYKHQFFFWFCYYSKNVSINISSSFYQCFGYGYLFIKVF